MERVLKDYYVLDNPCTPFLIMQTKKIPIYT